ncbi:hypothetical protein BDW74DRAFT_185159 [Aspergillus multicolor]|uniref:uncharacterized protein n=1 Tax=Aspergillus multicolor TaxID=41759 RepID=UPI003CCD4472
MLTLLSLVTLVSAAAFTPTPNARPTAIIDSGSIIGTAINVAIPSATVTPVSPWTEPFDASDYGPACYQQISEETALFYKGVGLGVVPNGESEDCLNLNVYAPATASAGSKAVIVWVHGGSWQNGANSLPLYDGSNIVANQDVVLVSINYRTNIFGFPADESIPVEERNLALHGTRLALDWVVRNIAFLGGDPSRITIAGESGGSSTVDTILTAPPDPLPFHAAILSSSQISVPAQPQQPELYIKSWNTLARLAGCPANSSSTLPCLQNYPAQDLVNLVTNASLTFNGFPDGGVTWSNTSRLDRLRNKTACVPVLIGTTYDEASPFTLGLNDTRSALDSIRLTEYTDLIIDLYPLGKPGISTETARITRIATEFLMQCNTALWADDSLSVGIPTYRFLYNASFPNTEFIPGVQLGAYHASELPLLFGTYRRANATAFQRELSATVQKAYADFAKSPASGPGWGSVPVIGVFGGGVRPGLGEERKALSTVDSAAIDVRCPLFYPVYEALSLGIGGE